MPKGAFNKASCAFHGCIYVGPSDAPPFRIVCYPTHKCEGKVNSAEGVLRLVDFHHAMCTFSKVPRPNMKMLTCGKRLQLQVCCSMWVSRSDFFDVIYLYFSIYSQGHAYWLPIKRSDPDKCVALCVFYWAFPPRGAGRSNFPPPMVSVSVFLICSRCCRACAE